MANPGRIAFKLNYEICPIIMTGGIADQMFGGMIPMLSLTDALGFDAGITGFPSDGLLGGLLGGGGAGLDEQFAVYQPLPGATLIDNKIGMYPFANQSVAANAVIVQPLTISMLMICPARQEGDYWAKQGIISALQSSFQQHNISGGLYTIATPSFMYTDCVMTQMTDVSRRDSLQVQNAFKIDFIQPLVTMDQAEQAQNQLTSAIEGGTPTDGSLSGPGNVAGNPQSLDAGSIVPASSNVAGAGVAGNSIGLA